MKLKYAHQAPPNGRPAYMTGEDDLDFRLGAGMDLPEGRVFRAVPQDDQWQLATTTYRTGAPLVVSDFRGKGTYRTWRVEPSGAGEGRGVILHPLHEGETFFRGERAYSTDPMTLSSGMRAFLEHVGAQETFNRVSVASATRKGWGDTSRNMALAHNYGFIVATGEPTRYERDDPVILSLKSDKDVVHAPGNKMNYRKSVSWASLKAQWDEFLKSGAKTAEVVP